MHRIKNKHPSNKLISNIIKICHYWLKVIILKSLSLTNEKKKKPKIWLNRRIGKKKKESNIFGWDFGMTKIIFVLSFGF